MFQYNIQLFEVVIYKGHLRMTYVGHAFSDCIVCYGRGRFGMAHVKVNSERSFWDDTYKGHFGMTNGLLC